jgi:hypothetical protein
LSSAAEVARRKQAIVAASALLRDDITVRFAPLRELESGTAWLRQCARVVAGQPLALAVAAAVVVAVAPRRVFGVLRWAIVTVPMTPIGRRLLSALAGRLLQAATGSRNAPDRR